MIAQRQWQIHARLPKHAGHVRNDFHDLERLLSTYAYTEQELDVIEKGLVEFEEQVEAKRIAKEAKRAALKEARNRERKKHAGGR